MIRISVVVGGIDHEVGLVAGDPATPEGREVVAAMVRDWADDYEQGAQ